MKIVLELEKNVDQNASSYFEKAKKLRKKLEGARKALVKSKEKLEKQKTKSLKQEKKEKKIEEEKSRKKQWYEKFRWFFSSDGFLVIGGKDATSNEVVVKKHADKNDLVFHTEAPGSPFIIIKNPDNKDIPDSTKEEAAIECLTFSKAWSKNMKSGEVYEIKPEQVSKEAQSGEYLGKGAFMIYGKRKYYSPVVSLGIGLLKDKAVMSGPFSAVKKNCEKFIELKQGDLKKGEVSKSIMKKFDLHTNDDIISNLPAGKFSISN